MLASSSTNKIAIGATLSENLCFGVQSHWAEDFKLVVASTDKIYAAFFSW